MTAGLYKKPKAYADMGEAIGETLGQPKQEGVRDVQIGNAQAWYYHEDNILVLWEYFLESRFRDHPLTHDPQMKQLWQGFEFWLLKQFPQATRIATPSDDPLFAERSNRRCSRPGTLFSNPTTRGVLVYQTGSRNNY